MNEPNSQGTTVQHGQQTEWPPREEPKATDVNTTGADVNTSTGGGGGKGVDGDGDEL